jgi:hypothetical protein
VSPKNRVRVLVIAKGGRAAEGEGVLDDMTDAL